jgi:hypothetical protein
MTCIFKMMRDGQHAQDDARGDRIVQDNLNAHWLAKKMKSALTGMLKMKHAPTGSSKTSAS